MKLPEPVYIVVPHQLPPRVFVGQLPANAHDAHRVYECATRADLERLANPTPQSDAHQRAAVAALAKRELDRL